jgi:hypothetical protein
MSDADKSTVVIFRVHTQINQGKSDAAGRPIYEDIEVCELRFPGNRLTVGVYPAHSRAGWRTNDYGAQEAITYAMKYPEQYRRFKEGRQQVQDGTPLSELTFLSQSKRLELKALNVHTAEQLAGLDGQNLKTLGQGGRELKNQAQAYLDKASGSADVTKLASENVALREQIEQLRRDMDAMKPSGVDSLDDEGLKELIKERTGSRPRGNPSHDTLVRMATEAA